MDICPIKVAINFNIHIQSSISHQLSMLLLPSRIKWDSQLVGLITTVKTT